MDALKPVYLFEIADLMRNDEPIEPAFTLFLILASHPSVSVRLWSSYYPQGAAADLQLAFQNCGVTLTPLAFTRMVDDSEALAPHDVKARWLANMDYSERAALRAAYETDPNCVAVLSRYRIPNLSGGMARTEAASRPH